MFLNKNLVTLCANNAKITFWQIDIHEMIHISYIFIMFYFTLEHNNTTEGVSLSVYPTEGSGKTCTKIKETAHTLGGYIGREPMMAAQDIFQPRRERVVSHLLYVSSLPDFSVQMKAKRFLLCLSLIH